MFPFILPSPQVDPWLHGIVYGESVMNDGVCIVLYQSFSKYILHELTAENFWLPVRTFIFVLVGSVLVGMSVSLLGAALLKILLPRDTRVEVTLLFLFSYAAFQVRCSAPKSYP